MRTLYFDCGMGAAGDMLAAALLELLPDSDAMISELNKIGIPGVRFIKEESVKCGIKGTHLTVKVNDDEEESRDVHEHSEEEHSHVHCHDCGTGAEHSHGHHRSLQDIEQIIGSLRIPGKVKNDVLEVYRLIAEAESHVHGALVTEIHFHEVGTMDAVADITAVCMIMNRLNPDEVVVSPVHTGCGQVKCAHGILPVPAPATAYILQGIPVYGGNIRGELCTPTGAALLKYFADRFGSMPVMTVNNIGYGMGKKDFEAANCVRALLGETGGRQDFVLELSCNVDDMTGEEIGYATEQLLAGGALDVYTVSIGMKKSRPGIMICVMCNEDDRNRMVELMFKHTTTIGIREKRSRRFVLGRESDKLDTPYGTVRRKDSAGYGTNRSKYEYEDIARIAGEKNVSISEVRNLIMTYDNSRGVKADEK